MTPASFPEAKYLLWEIGREHQQRGSQQGRLQVIQISLPLAQTPQPLCAHIGPLHIPIHASCAIQHHLHALLNPYHHLSNSTALLPLCTSFPICAVLSHNFPNSCSTSYTPFTRPRTCLANVEKCLAGIYLKDDLTGHRFSSTK
uniref:Uncharacterized protein n=1 Tax=Micrurus surinamensis TaxID=129470 RepID=A0A2D4PKX4_MICSU